MRVTEKKKKELIYIHSKLLEKNLYRLNLIAEQKQSFPDVLQTRYFWKFHKIHRKTFVLESLFNKVAGVQPASLQLY